MDDKIPITNVTANPLTAPVPIVNNAIAAISVVIFASDIVENAFWYPAYMLALGELPLSISSRIRSKINTLASTAMPTVKTIPAIHDKVNVALNKESIAIIITMFAINAIFAINPKSL